MEALVGTAAVWTLSFVSLAVRMVSAFILAAHVLAFTALCF